MHKLSNRLAPLTVALWLLGCQTFGPAMISAASAIAGLAAEWSVRQYPQHASAFRVAENALSAMSDTGTYDPILLAAALKELPVDALSGPTGDLYVAGMVLVFDLARGLAYEVTSQGAVQRVLLSVRDGFRRGLANQTMTGAYTSAKTRAAPALAEPKMLYPARNHTGALIRRI